LAEGIIKNLPPIARRTFLTGASIAGVAAVGTLAGCAPTATTSGGKTKINIASWMQFEPGRKEAWASVLKRFNDQSDTIEVAMVGWPFAEFSNQMLTQIQAGALEADIITAPPDLASRLFSLNSYSPLTDAIAQAGISPLKPLHKFVSKGDEFYGVSSVTVSFGLLYNQAMFDAAGIAPATSVDEWAAQTEALTSRPDSFGLIAANTMAEAANFWFNLQNWVNAYDGVWAKGKKPVVTSDPVIKTLELYKKMFDSSMPKGSNDAQQMELMGSGRASQGLLVSATVNVLKGGNAAAYPDMRSAAAPWASGKGTARVHPISLYEGTKNKEAATEFLGWLLKAENMADLMMQSLDVLAPYPEIEQVPEFQTYLKDLQWVDGYMDVDPVTPMDLMGDFINANDEFGNILLSHFQTSLNDNVPVADAMAKAQTELEGLASRL
jgi:multiple sugar transport system substrate-binding protein